MKRILIIWMATFFVVWPASLSAQQQPGRMKGRVVDESGNPAANVDVKVRSVDTGTENTVQTDAQGNFVIPELQPGKYLVQTISNQTTATPAQSKVDPPTSNFVLLSNPKFNDIRGIVASNPRTFQLALRVIF